MSTATAPWVFGSEKTRHKGVKIEYVQGKHKPWKEAAKEADLTWLVELRNPQSADLDAIPADEWKQVVKVTDDLTTLSKKYLTLAMVGLRYTIAQNEKVFGWFDKVTLEGAAIIRAAGHRDHGKQVWMIADRPMSVELYPGVLVEEKLILESSHDGSAAIRVCFRPHVTVNGVTIPVGVAFPKKSKIVSEVRIRHTKNLDVKLSTVDKILDQEGHFFEAWRASILGDNEKPGFLQKVVTELDVKAIVERLAPAHKKKVEENGQTIEVEEVSSRAEKARGLILERIKEQQKLRVETLKAAGKPVEADKISALDAFLGVSSYVALDKKTRNEGNQWVGASFGTGASDRQKAFEILSGL